MSAARRDRGRPDGQGKVAVKRQKNDIADAEAICEAVTRANMRFVPTKTPAQQSCLMLHRTASVYSPADRGDQFDPGSAHSASTSSDYIISPAAATTTPAKNALRQENVRIFSIA